MKIPENEDYIDYLANLPDGEYEKELGKALALLFVLGKEYEAFVREMAELQKETDEH